MFQRKYNSTQSEPPYKIGQYVRFSIEMDCDSVLQKGNARILAITNASITLMFEKSVDRYCKKEGYNESLEQLELTHADIRKYKLKIYTLYETGDELCRAPKSSENKYFPTLHDIATQSILIDRKRWRRSEKNKLLPNIFILKFSHNPNFNELPRFLDKFVQNIKYHKPNFRVQLLVRVEHSGHWATVDLYVDANKVINTLILDAAGNGLSGRIATELKKYFPTGKHYRFVPTFYNEERMQYSTQGCNIFAITHASKLSAMSADNLYSTLACITFSDTKSFSFNSIRYYPNHTKILVPLIAGTQSIKTINSLPKSIQNTPIGKEKSSLERYVADHTSIDENDKKTSMVIQLKSIKKAQQLTANYGNSTKQELEAIMMFRSGEILIDNPRLLEVYNNPDQWPIILNQLRETINANSLEIAPLNSKMATLNILITEYLTQAFTVQSNFIKFKLILCDAITVHQMVPEEHVLKYSLGRALNLSEFYVKDDLLENLKFLTELALEQLLAAVEKLVDSMPLSKTRLTLFQQDSIHKPRHEEMGACIQETRPQISDGINTEILKRAFLRKFLFYSDYIIEHGKDSKQLLENFSSEQISLHK